MSKQPLATPSTPHLTLDPPPLSAGARAAIVNRTHRVVRERADQMNAQKKSRRELILPLLICSAVLLLVCYAAWVVVSGTAFGAVGSEIEHKAGKLLTGQTIDTGSPAILLLLWFLPITVATIAALYLRRLRQGSGRDAKVRWNDPLGDKVKR